MTPDLAGAFLDWQTLVEGTRGSKGLYHANIDPAKDYTMTREQWQRSVEVLEKELGLEGQPRAVVLHEKHGREHIHVVWARTDIDEMILRSDSQNYQAHERASQQLEQEFGHEHVPGKHAKRDREKQPEFPRAEADHAEWQQGERTGIDPAARKEQITALKQASDNARAFKAALEEQGYILAKGDRRDFVIVDQTGTIHSLGRQIHGVKPAELREFMKEVDRESLPTATQAKELQQQRQEEVPKEEVRKQETQEQETRKKEEVQKKETQKQEVQKEAAKKTDAEPAKLPEPVSDPVRAQTEALKKAFAERQEADRRQLVEAQKGAVTDLRHTLDRGTREKLGRLDATHRAQAEALRARREQEQKPAGVAGVFHSAKDIFSPGRVAEREAELRQEQEDLAQRQKKERDDYSALLQQTNGLEIENLTERHAQQLRDHATRGEEDLERYLREQEAARRLQAELEERERQREEERTRDGPERPPPSRSL
ncbi:MAG: relaxase/mobilization nuclease domain-containing protein [Thermoanaerobaculia bacterium]